MEYRKLGKAGLPVSQLSFGTWITFGNQISYETAKELMVIAYESGINFFDNAEIYANGRSEEVMGSILKEVGWSRDSYAISSKVFFGSGGKLPTQRGLHRKHIREACDDALRRLQVDYLDIYFCHRPDKSTPIEETVWSMHQLFMAGKILYWGTSEWSAQEIMEAHMIAARHNLIGPVVEQPQYNMLHRQKVEVEFSQIYKTVGLGLTTWSPLASGLLTGKYNNGIKENYRLKRAELNWLAERNLVEENLTKVSELLNLAREIGTDLTRMAIAWCLKNPNVSTVLLGASKPEQLKHNLKAPDVVPLLTEEVMEKIENILKNKPIQPMF
ncbi:potassium channel beta subunit family protein [Schleiferia thermophila]|uniref:Voltage-dependent potassium channel beta subunit n=1 Tax=Schleiferia thermophila TaxID=884107 RepID=A0A369A8E7_9FLAO|nr:aldo/keto reductase [Schleiferia thermophila]RCX05415.1 voltage-dependent potassium channel beta subunit [Schleiferia thermophila]GCD79081.1 NADP-dependent aryl-alcohol dehydrogenase [Schleiferia thermophila]